MLAPIHVIGYIISYKCKIGLSLCFTLLAFLLSP